MGEAGGCVYVKESVLRELEQERRRLKWQLSRAIQTSDTRAAELEASKAKVKDLLTIVEVNKGVADQAVQRSHIGDAKRRAELEALHQQIREQRRRYVDLTVHSMNQRVHDRLQRDTFRLLHRAVRIRTQRRQALAKLHARFRWRTLRWSLEMWKRFCCIHACCDVSCSAGSAKVHPLSPELQCVRPSSTSSVSHTSATSRRLFLQEMWRNWAGVVRRKRRRREFIKRSLQFAFVAWRSRSRMRRQRRVLLRRIVARTRQRLQQFGLGSFRLRCAEVASHEWARVLEAAHSTMEEERKLRSNVQASVASELHAAYAREQQRQQRFTELQTQHQEAFKRRERKHRTLMALRSEVIHTRQHNTIALRFQRLQLCQRITRRVFAAWKREVIGLKRIRSLMGMWDVRRTRSTIAICFRLFAREAQRRRQRRLRLCAVLSKIRKFWLLRGWICLSIHSAIEEHKAIAHVEQWQLSQQVETTQNACLEDIRRSRRIALKYQVTCALLMADRSVGSLLRRVFSSWSMCTASKILQRRTMKRLIARKRVHAIRDAIHKWIHVNEEKSALNNQLCQFERTRCRRAVVVVFDAWKRSTREKLRLRRTNALQRSSFCAWHHWNLIRRQRERWFGWFLQRSKQNQQRLAFQIWKRKHDAFTKICSRREATERELISRLWRRWIGFIAFRLHKQRRQHRRALSGITTALHRTILSAVFASWRAIWRQDQARETLIIRAVRRRSGVRRCWRAWRQYSELKARRHRVLRRMCQRQRVRRLRGRWLHWIKASLCTKLAILEASSLKAQRQVDSVARSTSRFSLLRHTVLQWKSVCTEAKRQYRRQALFMEKRRYLALQGSVRQWQRKIACCSLTKQRRVLQQLLHRRQVALQRQTLRTWERWAHSKTLITRDRVSAELFRRSEARVLALAEDIRAEREQRTVFTAWRSATARTKKACDVLCSTVVKYHHRLTQRSWRLWKLDTRTQRCVDHLTVIVTRRLKVAAWRKLVQVSELRARRARGAQRVGGIWYKVLLRHAWHDWKRMDSFLSRQLTVAGAKAASIRSILAFKQTLAKRQHRKRVLSDGFATWKLRWGNAKRLCRRLCGVLDKLQQTTAAYHFQKWREVTEIGNAIQSQLYRVLKCHQSREVRSAFNGWRRLTLEKAHGEQLAQTAKQVVAVKLLSWQRSCLEAHFVRWKLVVEQKRAIAFQISYRRLRTAWHLWYGLVLTSKRKAQVLAKIVDRMMIALLARGFYRWGQWLNWKLDVDAVLIRLVRVRILWQWKRGLAALRRHHNEGIRRQSVMAASVFSAHSTRQRERQTQMMCAVALVLQRKTGIALCGRCFRQWVVYIKTKEKMTSMARLTHLRAQNQIIRRSFFQWQLHTRQVNALHQKILRRQEIWQGRRQRLVWNAWVFFTQHSLDTKYWIYDRLASCVLRHSLQSAWGRWKTCTRREIDAERKHAAAERDRLIDTLENKHECLLLRAALLGQQNNALRQKLASAAAQRIHRALELGQKARISTAFDVWKRKLCQAWTLQSRLTALGLQYLHLSLHRWRSTVYLVRISGEITRVKLNATEWAARTVHICAIQWLKRRVFVCWKVFYQTRRGFKRYSATAKRRRERRLVQICWKSWTSILDTRAQQQDAATALQAKRGLKTVLQAYWRWRSGHERYGIAKQNAIRTMVLLLHTRQHRLKVYGWHRWRNLVKDEDVAALRTRLLWLELEQEEAADHQKCSQLLLRTFSNWKMHALNQHDRRKEQTRVFAVASHHRRLYHHFKCWKHWTAGNQARLLLLRRTRRHLSHHYLAVTKFALWVWFCRAQTGSPSLKRLTTQLQVASRQFLPSTDVPARIAHALFTDLLLAEHQLLRAKQHSAWRLANASVRSARLRVLQTAFIRLASGIHVPSKRRLLMQKPTANARAFVDKMETILLRSGFQRWRQQYLVLAIQEAEEAQHELLRALHHMASYRQALDPYGNK
ncbi:hypothetical protein P3T76_001926 [Phytophthora citrophthora]|uniref:Sfi1 spindle body domain-containing protein n=1 Tax=Phytophthora citrophthora TaxID=4793 RepID=A0AAD9LQX6_9STRA|nr:hypothetical protein P3T76_001926 [Phytophthora citrophthora]